MQDIIIKDKFRIILINIFNSKKKKRKKKDLILTKQEFTIHHFVDQSSRIL